jgi:hypothetical protein
VGNNHFCGIIEEKPNRHIRDVDAIELIKRIGEISFCGELAERDKASRDRAQAGLATHPASSQAASRQ